jgi:hypothetical protein
MSFLSPLMLLLPKAEGKHELFIAQVVVLLLNRHTQFINGLQVTASEASAGLTPYEELNQMLTRIERYCFSLTPEQRQEFDHAWGLQSYDLKELLNKKKKGAPVTNSILQDIKSEREMEIKEINLFTPNDEI